MLKMQDLGTELTWFLQGEGNGTGFFFPSQFCFLYFGLLLFVKLRLLLLLYCIVLITTLSTVMSTRSDEQISLCVPSFEPFILCIS